MLRSIARLALVLFLVLPARTQAQQWSAQRVVSIGEDQGLVLGAVRGMTVTPDGRLFVLDGMESRVHVFSAAGKLERSFGKRGAGPGELSNLAMTLLLSRDQLVVVDMANQRINLFGTDGSFVRSRPWNIRQGVALAWVAAGDRVVFMIPPMPAAIAAQVGGATKYTILALDPRSDAAPDTLLALDLPSTTEMSMGATIKMKIDMRAPQVQLSSDGNGRVLVAVTDTYRIRVLTPDGKTTGWLTRNVSRRRYTSAELARMKQEADSSMATAFNRGAAAAGGRGMPRPEVEFILPEYVAAIAGLLAGDRFVLVGRTGLPSSDIPVYEVLSYDGKLAGTLTLPKNFTPLTMWGDRVYGVEKDDLDVESIAIYRIGPSRQ